LNDNGGLIVSFVIRRLLSDRRYAGAKKQPANQHLAKVSFII
jgi:hypothetical protein